MNEEVITGYQKLDLTPLLGDGKYIVFCKTEYEAQCLLAALKSQFPEKCERWSLPNVNWNDTCGDGQLYFPDINDAEHCTLSWNDVHYPGIERYIVINCDSLFEIQQELDESDIPIDFLLGGTI